MSTRIRLRRDTAANWTSANPTLTTGEMGYETDTGKFKIGNNTNAWTALPYSITAELSEGNLNDLKDVTITSAANGDFLRWNGTAWINDAVNLSTDTVGSYVASLVEGTGVTITNNSGEGATPTVAIGQSVATSASVTFARVTISETPSANTDAVTKSYVDNIASGINWHEAVSYATSAVLPNTPSYSNGVGGVGATLTAGSNARLIVDGLNASTGNRILVKNQSSQIQNGIYEVTAQGSVSAPWVLTRAEDFNQDTSAGSIDTGEAVYVRLGNSNAGTGYVLTSTGTGTGDRHVPGTDSLVFTQFSGLTATVAGAGLATDGAVLSIGTASSGRIVVNAEDIDLATVAQSNSTDASGLFFAKTVNVDSYGRVTGVVSASVDLSSKANLDGPSFTGTVVLPSTTSIGNVTSTEIGYLDGVTSAIQTQIDAKAPLASPTFTGTVVLPDNTVALGTKTTGDYVATITGGTGVSSTAATTGEGTTHTLSIGQDVASSATPTFAGLNLNGSVVFEGATANEFETTLAVTDPTADRTITLPDATTTLVGTDTTQTLSHKTLTTPTINGGEFTATGGTPRIHGIYLPEPHFITFEGSTTDEFETVLTVLNPTADRTVSLPDASGTVALSGSIALGTDTTGNYVNDLTAGTGVTITHTPSEGSSPTVAIGQAVGTSASVTFGQVTTTGNVIVGGNLTVSGTTTSVNTETLTIDDNIIVLNNNVTSTPSENAGIEVERGTSANVLVRWNETTDKWEATNDGTNYGNLVTTADSGTVTSTMIADGTIVDADINASAGIALSKLATSTAGNIIVYNSSGVPTSVTETGDVTISDTGVTSIASGVIVNADVSDSAAIDLNKLADVSTNAQTASYTLVLADKNKIVEMGVGSANNLTVPLNASVAFPVGSQINILQTGSGQTTIVAAGGVTINASPGLKMRTQWSYATLIKRATNTWVLVGDISA